jgi:hypothetical protein
MSISILASCQQLAISDQKFITKRGKLGKHEEERVHHSLAGLARGIEKTEVYFPEDYVGSLKGPSPGEGSRCKAS